MIRACYIIEIPNLVGQCREAQMKKFTGTVRSKDYLPFMSGPYTKSRVKQQGIFVISRSSPHSECIEDASLKPNINDLNRHFGIYRHLSRTQNSVVLPPLTSRRTNYIHTMDVDKLREKRYILKDKLPSLTKFERDEVFIPSVYTKQLDCPDCRNLYVTKMFTKQYLHRNNRSPECSKSSGMAKERRHYCDVLGKRSCGSCMEFENKNFSRSLYKYLPLNFKDSLHGIHSVNRAKKRIRIALPFAYL